MAGPVERSSGLIFSSTINPTTSFLEVTSLSTVSVRRINLTLISLWLGTGFPDACMDRGVQVSAPAGVTVFFVKTKSTLVTRVGLVG